MAFSINTNIAALNAHRNLTRIDNQTSNALARLSTGLRINKAADDASGLAIANAFKAQSLGISQAIQNGTDATSLTQIADGALEESTNIINTIRTKAVQAASDGQTTETRRLIQNDIDRLLGQLDNIAQNTSFNGQKLLSGAFVNKSFQIGANANQTFSVSIGSTESTKLGHISTANLSLTNADGGDVQLKITSSITGEQLTLNTVSVKANNKAENGLGALADEINRYSSTTGISATAVVETTGGSSIKAGTTGTSFAINGVTIGAITVQANDANGALVKGINAKQAETGILASTTNDGKLELTSNDGRAIKVTGDLGGVAGATAGDLSTIGRIQLVQSGVSDFQIGGIGAAATGADFTVKTDVTTVEDAILASGSTIKTDSVVKAGSTLGGDVTVKTDVTTTQDSVLTSGSSLKADSVLVKGTTTSGSLTVKTDTNLAQDAVLKAGSTLKSGSVLGKGTVVATQFTEGGTTYAVGTVLTSKVTLSADLTVASDQTLKYSSTAADNSSLKADSVLTSGTLLGADLTVKTDATITDNLTLKTGSTLKADSKLLAGSTTGGSITVKTDTTTYQSTTLETGSLLKADSVLKQGSNIGVNTTVKTDTVLKADQTLKAGSLLKTGSILKAGTVLTQDIEGRAAGSVLSDNLTTTADVTLGSDLQLKLGSTIKADSVLATNTTNTGSVGLNNKQVNRLADLSVLTAEGAQTAIAIADAALKGLDDTRASLGAVQNQFTSTLANLAVTLTNVNAAESAIRDVDFASEAGNFSRLQILAQAGAFALSQANASAQSVLSLLQR
jgi:flagellin